MSPLQLNSREINSFVPAFIAPTSAMILFWVTSDIESGLEQNPKSNTYFGGTVGDAVQFGK